MKKRANKKFIKVIIENIEYDTVANGVDFRKKLSDDEIPSSLTAFVSEELSASHHHTIGMLLAKSIEGNWLVNRFDWQIIEPTPGQVYHVECAVRRKYGVDISHDLDWLAETGGNPYTCVPISRKLKAA